MQDRIKVVLVPVKSLTWQEIAIHVPNFLLGLYALWRAVVKQTNTRIGLRNPNMLTAYKML